MRRGLLFEPSVTRRHDALAAQNLLGRVISEFCKDVGKLLSPCLFFVNLFSPVMKYCKVSANAQSLHRSGKGKPQARQSIALMQLSRETPCDGSHDRLDPPPLSYQLHS
jgi:hypothetical protein